MLSFSWLPGILSGGGGVLFWRRWSKGKAGPDLRASLAEWLLPCSAQGPWQTARYLKTASAFSGRPEQRNKQKTVYRDETAREGSWKNTIEVPVSGFQSAKRRCRLCERQTILLKSTFKNKKIKSKKAKRTQQQHWEVMWMVSLRTWKGKTNGGEKKESRVMNSEGSVSK